VKQFITKHDIWLRLLSLALAFVLWAIVMGEENPTRAAIFSGITVNVTGQDELLEEYGLSLIEMDMNTVTVHVSGPRNSITPSELQNRITAELDISGCTEAGEYDLKPLVSVQRAGVEVTNVTPRTIHVRVDKMTTMNVPVRVEAVGSPAEGFRAGRPEPVTANKVTVQGPVSELEETVYAYAVISADGKTATVTEECPITLYNGAGEPITGAHVTCLTERIKVRLPIYPIETIPLSVTLRGGGSVTEEETEVSIEPDSVKVIGDPNVIAGMKEIDLGELNLDSVRTGVPIEMEIPLPDGVRLDEGQPTTAKVTVTIDGIETRTVEVSKIALNDTAEQSPYTAAVAAQSLPVELRGSASALDEVDESGLTIGITFDSAALGEGAHMVRGVVVASNLPDGVSLVEQDVQVMLEITLNDQADGVLPDGGQHIEQPDAALPEEGGDAA
jgi:YbbR domain-containing protein